MISKRWIGPAWSIVATKGVEQESSENDLGQPSFWVYEGIWQIEEIERSEQLQTVQKVLSNDMKRLR